MEDRALPTEDLETILQAAWGGRWETEGFEAFDKMAEEAKRCMEGTRTIAETSSKQEWEARVKEEFKKGNNFGHSITKPMPATCVAEVPDEEGGTTTAVNKIIQHYAQEWGSW